MTKRTIQGHLRQNHDQLQNQIASLGSQHTINYLQSCYDQTTQLLANLAEGSQVADGWYYCIMLWLLAQCFKLDFHTAESATGDADAVMTDVDGK